MPLPPAQISFLKHVNSSSSKAKKTSLTNVFKCRLQTSEEISDNCVCQAGFCNFKQTSIPGLQDLQSCTLGRLPQQTGEPAGRLMAISICATK
eukprot:16338715-Heterocapsa_arctica.AAC.1